MISKNHRIKRLDAKNLVIQRRTDKGHWITRSYYGNSAKSLISGLLELAMAEYSPDEENLCKALETLELRLDSIVAEVENLISNADLGVR
jgi:hypothetical protein